MLILDLEKVQISELSDAIFAIILESFWVPGSSNK